MPIFAESKKEIFADVLNDVLSNTNITETSPGSKARSIIESVTNKLGDVWSKFDANMAHAFLDGAEGRYLDYFGDMMGLTRGNESAARVSASDKLIKFYRDPNDLTGDIPIPAGTIISTLPDGAGIVYITTAAGTLANQNDSVYVTARSRQVGAKVNVGKNTLTYHNVSLPLGITSSLQVTNEGSITSGTGIESDDNFRFRISKQIRSNEAGNYTAIRMAALGVPGVADVQILPFFRGVGTFDLLVKSTSPSVSQNLITNVRESLYFAVAQGVSFNVRRPKETGVTMELTVILNSPREESFKTNLTAQLKSILFDYIDNLDIGEELIINEVIQRVMAASDEIKTMGTTAKPIDKLSLYKEQSTSAVKIPYDLIALGGYPADYTPAMDEKLLIHNVGIPIKITIQD